MEGVEGEEQERQLEMVTVNADTSFEFPSPEFLTDLEKNGLGHVGPDLGVPLSQAYRALLNVLALPLSPMGSEGLLEKQVSEICRRFRRYKNTVFAMALDNEDDRKTPGDGVDPEEVLHLSAEKEDPLHEKGRDSLKRRIGQSIAWTAAGALVEREADLDRSGIGAGSVESVPSLPSDQSNLDGPDPPLVSVTLGDSDECLIRERF